MKCIKDLNKAQHEQLTDVMLHLADKRFLLMAHTYSMCPHCALRFALLMDLMLLQREGVQADEALAVIVSAFNQAFDAKLVGVAVEREPTPPHGGTVH